MPVDVDVALCKLLLDICYWEALRGEFKGRREILERLGLDPDGLEPMLQAGAAKLSKPKGLEG